MEPKLAVLMVLIGVILSLSYFSHDDKPGAKSGPRQIPPAKP